MSRVIVDSSAWIEYLSGSQKGKSTQSYIDSNELYTTSLCVAEIAAKAKRENYPLETALQALQSLSKIITIDFEMAKEAGALYVDLRRNKPKISLSDAITVVAAHKKDAKILTFDRDFEKLPQTILLK